MGAKMKKRTGFVSNSSSSSFVIAVKEGDLESSFQKVLSGIKTTEDFPMKELVERFISIITGAFVDNATEYTYDEYMDEFCWEPGDFEDMYPEIYDKVKNHGWKLYQGSVSDDDYDNMGAMMLVPMGIDYKTDDIIINKEEYY
jgi:hypothetical protein